MKSVNPYLNFNGNTEEAFNFYKSVFGGEFLSLMRFKDIPGESPIPEEAKNGIMHISLQIAPNVTLMGTDAIESMGQVLQVGNNTHILLEAESREEADKLFSGLSQGGKIEMPMADQFWGDYYGNFADKFGINWMISFTSQT
ncbi:MAG: VOC family protein [Melioribacteraceae bacterium]|nr:VOC family protein [Melioribacteraceae bacterium]